MQIGMFSTSYVLTTQQIYAYYSTQKVIIAGGTMQPTADLKSQLFAAEPTDRIREFFYDHVVAASSILPIALSCGPTNVPLLFNFASRQSATLLDELRRTLTNVCSVTPAGVVAFFTSYDQLATFGQTLDRTPDGQIAPIAGKRVFREERTGGQRCDQMLGEYARAVRQVPRGALLLSVVGGKLSEGLNFSDDLGRCVIVIGLPFPNRTSAELSERMAYLERTLGRGAGDEYYENVCMKAVNQCIGM